MSDSIAITTVARPGSQAARLLAEADRASGTPDERTSLRELDAYLARHQDVRALIPSKLINALRAKVGRNLPAELPSAEAVLAERTITAEQAAALVQPGERVLIPTGHMAPPTLLEALHARAQQPGQLDPARQVKLFGAAIVIDPKIFGGLHTIKPEAYFVDGSSRLAIATGNGSFIPTYLHRAPRLVREGLLPIDKAFLRVSLPDADGYVSLGTSCILEPEAVRSAKTVIAEMSPSVPRINGAARVHVSELHHIVRSNAPVKPLPVVAATEVDMAIAKNVVGLIPDDATLQFGIGGVPNAVATELASQGRKGFHIHSEMVSDGVMLLDRSGAIKGDIRFCFAMGSDELLRWMDNNPRLVSLPIDESNDPAALGRIDKLVAINTALRVDLRGQVNAQMVNGMWYSGVGGQVDFMRGAATSPGGRAILVLQSTRVVKGKDGASEIISNIIPQLGSGDVVTTSMHDLHYLVTEYGVAHLEGKTTDERAHALIAVAHPDFREKLTKDYEAERAGVAQAAQRK